MTRMERIERLLHELRYEVERGMMEREVDETISYEFCVPFSHSVRGGVVQCSFRTRPTLQMPWQQDLERLRVVK